MLLILLIGGRIIPSFTRNWLARYNPGRLPAPFARFDMIVVAVGAAALMLWIVAAGQPRSGRGWRIADSTSRASVRWAGDRTLLATGC